MSWLITLEALSAQEENLYQAISLQEKKSTIINNNILNRHIPRRRSRPQQTSRITINTGRQFSFDSISELQFPSWCALQLQSGVQVWRRVVGAAATIASFSFDLNISWLGFGLSDQLFVMCCPWGLMCYSLFGYLAQGFLLEEFSIKVKVLGGRLQPMVG